MPEVVGKLRAALATVNQEKREALMDAWNEATGGWAHPLLDGDVPLRALFLMGLAALPADTEEAFQVLAQVDGLPLVGAAPAVNPAGQVDR